MGSNSVNEHLYYYLQVRGLFEINQFIQLHYCNADGEQLMPSDACIQRSCEPKERTIYIKLKRNCIRN